MRIHIRDEAFVLEADDDDDENDEKEYLAIIIDRHTDSIRFSNRELTEAMRDECQTLSSFGIIGSIPLLRGRYLVHVSEATKVCGIMGHDVFRVDKVNLIAFSISKDTASDLTTRESRAEEAIYLKMIQSVFDTNSFFFSHTFDLTHTWQRLSDSQTLVPSLESSDERFFWNKFMLSQGLSELQSPWAIVLMRGFIEVCDHTLEGHSFTYALISRRSCKNAGTRFTRRGLNEDGNAVNFCEQEQMVITSTSSSPDTTVVSFVQTRGSIPLVWSQLATQKWAPLPKICDGDGPLAIKIFNSHIKLQTAQYQRQIMINLINQTGSELKLKLAFESIVERSRRNDLRLVSFDFHHECRRMQWQNIDKLIKIIDNEFVTIGYWHANMNSGDNKPSSWDILRRQQGVFRTNCMDCLDRTNVVQSVLATKVLLTQFRALGFHEGELQLGDMPAFETMFKNIWADNADAMSVCYSGTPALKTDFTRTGKRTVIGAIKDAVNSVKRYFINNFTDGYRQDALDLTLGNYHVKPCTEDAIVALPYHQSQGVDGKSAVVEFIVTTTLVLLCGVLFVSGVVLPRTVRPNVITLVAIGVLLGPILAMFLMHKKGRKFVDKPKLIVVDADKEKKKESLDMDEKKKT